MSPSRLAVPEEEKQKQEADEAAVKPGCCLVFAAEPFVHLFVF